MASQLTLDSNDNPDMAEAMSHCMVGKPATITVEGIPSKNEDGMMVMNVKSAECEDYAEEGAEDGEEEATPAPAKSKSKVAPAVSKVAMEM